MTEKNKLTVKLQLGWEAGEEFKSLSDFSTLTGPIFLHNRLIRAYWAGRDHGEAIASLSDRAKKDKAQEDAAQTNRNQKKQATRQAGERKGKARSTQVRRTRNSEAGG